ncbi:MAG: entericidin A/B family lipoprotein [Candidatus Auribacterota bacterium]|jgi:predicted small secreted protein|nr:entericidin A/B family lipoprotein [Candidatus Auribacterota bacterium]
MKKIFFCSFLLISLYTITLFLSGCGTVEGFGKDIQTLGKGISGVAD